jgi:hypothetical protein
MERSGGDDCVNRLAWGASLVEGIGGAAMYRASRRTAMKVKQGRVQRKNRTALSPHLFQASPTGLLVERRRSGDGYRHVVRRSDVRRFVELLPRWTELSQGLSTIVLDRGGQSCLGWYDRGVVAICAWEKEIVWDDCCPSFFRQHRQVFDKLSVPYEIADDAIHVHFTTTTARAFLLVHVLVHELGHHYDRMTTRTQRWCGRGEAYAEAYARQFEDVILARYRDEFDVKS